MPSAARAVEGVDVVDHQARRRRGARRAARSGRRIGIEAAHLTVARSQALAAGGVDLVPTTGVRRGAARGEGRRTSSTAIRRAAALSDEVFAALAASASPGAPSASSPGGSSARSAKQGAEALSFGSIVAAGRRTGRVRTGGPPTDRRRRGRSRHRRHGLRRRRLLLRLHADVRDRRAPGTARRGVRPLPAGAARRARSRTRRGTRPRRRRRVSRRRRGRRPRGGLRARARPRRRAGGPRGAGAPSRVGGRARGRQRRHRRARASTCRDRAVAGSRTSSSSPTTGARC